MSNSIVAAIYRYVIDDVVRNVHADFEGHGVDTSVLEELQRSWEAKIIQSRVASFPGEDSINSSHDVYAHANQFNPGVRPAAYHDYAGHAGAHNINSAASLASIINNPETMAPSAASLASLAQSGRGQLLLDDDDDADSDNQNHRYSSNGPNNNIPQLDGADEPVLVLALPVDAAMAKWQAIRDSRRQIYQHNIDAWTNRDRSAAGQLDGASDDEDDDDDDDDDDRNRVSSQSYDQHHRPTSSTIFRSGKVEAPEDAINSDLDDTDDENDANNSYEDSEHVVLCQYEKVTRSKNKWKCVLRDGIMLINGRDYLFQKATGEFEW
ncbi:transcription factor IIA subunit alpha [Coemansia sp. RSA 2050]|nr:transcription factor IIA subunit alpha [Coemansia sp. RSA 2050]KAJ2732641.1 transcription factor IIA subunit alpha [Coemansia sp. BCRC 34962]